MKATELTIDVNCNLKVDENTARTCLKLIELYVNSTQGVEIIATTQSNGYVEFKFDKSRCDNI